MNGSSEVQFEKATAQCDPRPPIYRVVHGGSPVGYVKRSASGGWCYTPDLDTTAWTRIPGSDRDGAARRLVTLAALKSGVPLEQVPR